MLINEVIDDTNIWYYALRMYSISYTSIICMIVIFHYDQPKQKHVLVCNPLHAWAREKACSSKIKLLLIVRVDATHHSTGPTCLPLKTWLKDPQCTIYLLQPLTFTPPQIKIYIPVLTRWACKLQSPGSQVGPKDYFFKTSRRPHSMEPTPTILSLQAWYTLS